MDLIEPADAAIAWLQGQYPFVVGPTGVMLQDPNSVASNSWPRHMEPQPLYPVAMSTYTWPTGTRVEVPCFAQDKVVEIKRAECPDSFVNPIDPNHVSPCVKVTCWAYLLYKVVLSCLFLSCTVSSCSVFLPCLVLSCLALLPCLALPCLA